jgi:hypothetical protein
MANMDMIFDSKFVEFAKDLKASCPELEDKINAALALSSEERMSEFKKQVLVDCSPKRNAELCPSFVLPGVKMTEEIWSSLSTASKKAIQEYMTLLSFVFLIDSGSSGDINGPEWTSEWARTMMDDMKDKMKNVDFAGISEKIASLFGAAGAGIPGMAGMPGMPGMPGLPSGFPQLPEKFLKGQIAKLAEDIVKELKVEDFGIDPAVMESSGNDPTKALGLIMEALRKNPMALKTTIERLTKKIQSKIQSGALRPNELVAEAEELMKTFSENPQFVTLMESFRQSFGAFDPEMSRKTNREAENRLNIVRERLRKKLAAKNKK